jgi:hypothetical protein
MLVVETVKEIADTENFKFEILMPSQTIMSEILQMKAYALTEPDFRELVSQASLFGFFNPLVSDYMQ